MAAQADVRYPDGVNPRRVVHELNARLPEGAIVTTDAGTTADWYGHHIRLRRGMRGRHLRPARLDDLRDAVRDRPRSSPTRTARSSALIGDGAFQMLGHERADHGQEVPAAVGEPPLRRRRDAQRRPRARCRGRCGPRTATPSTPGRRTWRASTTPGWAGCSASPGVRGARRTTRSVPAVEAALAHDGVTADRRLRHAEHRAAARAHHGRVRDEHREGAAEGRPGGLGVIVDSAEGLVAEQVERVKGALHLGRNRSTE